MDQYHEKGPPEGWPRWMERRIRESTYVLVICTEAYYRKALNLDERGEGKGVQFESVISLQNVYENRSLNTRFIPVLLRPSHAECIPDFLRPFQHYTVDATSREDQGYWGLYRHLTNQPSVVKPPQGDVLSLGVDDPMGPAVPWRNGDDQFESSDTTQDDSTTAVETGLAHLEITIDKPFKEFSEGDQDRILRIFRDAFSLSNGEVRIVRKRPGSVRLTLELPAKTAEELQWAIEEGRFDEFGIVRAELMSVRAKSDATMTDSANVGAKTIKFKRHGPKSTHVRLAHLRRTEPWQVRISEITPANVSNGGEFLIRLLDVVGALILFLLASPVMLTSALGIKLTSQGPILYRQKRVGKSGKIFILYKLRTMIQDAEKHVGPVWATKNDARVTPIGRVLRRTRIDELPQLFNILRGDMSLVGPRPERPFFVERHKALQGIRLAVKPGLTGLAQVRAFYDLKPAHKVKYDYLYIQRRSLLLNIYILLQTIPVLFCKKGW